MMGWLVILSYGTGLKLRIVKLTIFFSTACFTRAVFERSTAWWRTLRLKFGSDLYCTSNRFFHFLPRRDNAFSAHAERTPLHLLREVRSATGSKQGDCFWCGIGYWILKTGDFFYDDQYYFKTLFVLSYGVLYRELSFMYLLQFVKKSGSEFGNIVF